MKIQAGKFYRTRDGRKVGPIEPYHGMAKALYPYVFGQYRWTEEGTSGNLTIMDLVAEWIDPAAMVELPADVTPWAGGDCPVDPHAYVSVWLRGAAPNPPRAAHDLEWRHTGHADDIIGYRVLWAPAVKRSGEVWVNIYPGLASAFITREQAEERAGLARIACVRVEWTEGDGL